MKKLYEVRENGNGNSAVIAHGVVGAAKATNLSPNFIRKAIKGDVKGKPKLPTVRAGRRRLILDSALRTWLEK